VASVVALVWWLQHGQVGGIPWLGRLVATYVAISLVVGWLSTRGGN
jgi:hypothetical protein